jgi:hypothetical protein
MLDNTNLGSPKVMVNTNGIMATHIQGCLIMDLKKEKESGRKRAYQMK